MLGGSVNERRVVERTSTSLGMSFDSVIVGLGAVLSLGLA